MPVSPESVTNKTADAAPRLLVVSLSWLGDCIMAMPALATFRKRLPHAHITILAKPSVIPLWLLFPGMDGVIPLQKGYGGMRETISLVKAGNFDFVLASGPTTQTFIIPASILYRSFTVYQWVTNAAGFTSAYDLAVVTGNQSSYSAVPTNLPYVGPVQYGNFYPAKRFPLINGTDTTYSVQVGIATFPIGGSGPLNYVIVGDLQNTDVAVYNANDTNLNVAGTVTVIPSGQQHVILDSPLPLPVTNTNTTELYVRNLATDQLYVRNQSTDGLYLNTISSAITAPTAVNTRFGGLPVSNSMYQFGGQSYVNPMVSQSIGGVTKASVSVTTTAATTIIAAPAAGTYIRIQSIIVRGGTVGTTIRIYCATSTYDIWNAAINTAVNLNGQATSNGDGAITVAASGATTACVITITYDVLDQYTNA